MAAIDFRLVRSVRLASGKGHGNEADERQQTLFSWAEFMVVGPDRRRVQGPSQSLFEWAVEKEREAEPVGAAR